MFDLNKILSLNELRIFRAIYETGPVSRVRVARGLHLTRAAVTINIKRLQELGLIDEVGKGISSERRGRREVLLAVNPSCGYVISIHFALDRASFSINDLAGKILEQDMYAFPMGSQPDAILPSLTEAILNLLTRLKIDRRKVFGAGVAIPGIIRYKDEQIIAKSLVGWEGFPLRRYLSEKLECGVYLENDVKVLTLGEFQFGTSRHISNLVCLWMENGIGAGLMIEGRLIRGATSSAGEIGFNEFFLDSPMKQSIFVDAQPKCWGDILSFTNIRESIKRGIDEGWATTLTRDSDMDEFTRAVEAGDPLAAFIFRILSKIVSTVCKNLIYTFNPQTLVLSGGLFNQLPLLADEIRRSMRTSTLKHAVEAVELKTSILGQNGVLIGCVALVLEHLFKSSDQKSMFSTLHDTANLLD